MAGGEELAQALWYVGPGQAEIRQERLVAACGRPGARAFALQRDQPGHRGADRRRAGCRKANTSACARRSWAGQFPFPVKYGYATVGEVEAGPAALVGRNVFALHPHQTKFDVPAEAVVPVPGDIPLSRAVLAANIETALNATWDAAPGPSGRIAVVGAGVVGALVGFLCARIEGAEVTLIDIDPRARGLGPGAELEVRDARRGAGRLRFRVSRQRHGRGTCHRARHRRRRGDHRRAELVRRGDGRRCRSAARSTAAG